MGPRELPHEYLGQVLPSRWKKNKAKSSRRMSWKCLRKVARVVGLLEMRKWVGENEVEKWVACSKGYVLGHWGV